MKGFLVLLLIASWSWGIYLHSSPLAVPAPSAAGAKNCEAVELRRAAEVITRSASPSSRECECKSDDAVAAAPLGRNRTEEGTGANDRLPASLGSPREIEALVQLQVQSVGPKWTMVSDSDEQAIRFKAGGKTVVDKTPFYFDPQSSADLISACPSLVALKVPAVLYFDTPGTLAKVTSVNQKSVAIDRSVFDCRLAPRLKEGKPVPFKTLFEPSPSVEEVASSFSHGS